MICENQYRTKACGEVTEADIGKEVRVAGWVENIRDHGGVQFLDVRDQYGVVQVVVHNEALLKDVNRECAITACGPVVLRDADTINPKIATGTVEIVSNELEVLGKCRAVLPFDVGTSRETKADVRLKYRYLDLRNPKVHKNIVLRSEVISFLRKEMESLGFQEIQTPILSASSPEGARDYLIPSRRHKGKFYALPQAPQLFKQLLMVSGFDRYFQIAPCFRDEDARADRSPGEFYQLDFEMAFATQEDVFAIAETVLGAVFEKFGGGKTVTKAPFPRITYKESMLKYGTDKPDLRNPLEIVDLSDLFVNSSFKPFCNKYLSDEQRAELIARAKLEKNSVVFFIADDPAFAPQLAGQIREELAVRLKLIDESRFALCFIVDFPMYEIDEETGNYAFTHNPFSMPQGGLEALETKAPEDVLAYQYDIVCNGVELSSGAVRNHDLAIMKKAFEIAGYTEEELESKFSALYTAFQYGAPPHAGMAPGIDRMLMLLTGEENIREVIAFPMNSNAQDVMMGAPNEVSEQQLREVHIKLR